MFPPAILVGVWRDRAMRTLLRTSQSLFAALTGLLCSTTLVYLKGQF